MTRAKDISKILTDADISGNIDVDGTTNLDVVDIDGAVNFAADVTFADGADIITASAGTSNVRVGVNAGNSIASGGNYNTVIGDEAGTALTTGDFNVFLGTYAGDAGATISNNVGIGVGALGSDTNGNASTAIGHSALNAQNYGSGTTTHNTAVGYQAGVAVTSGIQNTLIGSSSGDGIVTGVRNTALGFNALSGAVDDGNHNTCIGADAGLLTTGSQNTFVGAYDPSTGGCGETMTTGSKNTILGAFNGNQGGLDIRTADNNIVLSDGDGVPRNRVVANGFTHGSGTAGVGRFGSMLGVTVADNASLSVQGSSASAGGLIISVYDTGSGAGGCFYATFRGGTTLIAEGISGDCSTSVADGKICVSKSSGSHTVTFTNTLGASREFYIGVYGAFVT